MRLPPELMCQIIRDIVDTPTVFIFDVDVAARPHPPLLSQSVHLRFRPLVDPPIGQHEHGSYPSTYESQISKTIRSLLLASKFTRAECLKYLQAINVPTVSRHAIVHFNPREHVICIHQVKFSGHQYVKYKGGPMSCTSWIKRDSDLLTALDFGIHHLAFMGHDTKQTRCHRGLMILRMAFPSIQHIYVAVAEQPRKNPSEPIDLVCPASDQGRTISPVFMHMARPCWTSIKSKLSSKHENLHRRREYSSMAHAQDLAFEELVLI